MGCTASAGGLGCGGGQGDQRQAPQCPPASPIPDLGHGARLSARAAAGAHLSTISYIRGRRHKKAFLGTVWLLLGKGINRVVSSEMGSHRTVWSPVSLGLEGKAGHQVVSRGTVGRWEPGSERTIPAGCPPPKLSRCSGWRLSPASICFRSGGRAGSSRSG